MYRLYLMLAQQMVTCALIIAVTSLLTYEKGTPEAKWRLILNILNTIIILSTVVSYEIRELMYSGLSYFKEGSNVMDCIFLVTFGEYLRRVGE